MWSESRISRGEIVYFYRNRKARGRRPLPAALSGMCLSTSANGIGDLVVLTDVPRAAAEAGRRIPIYTQNTHFSTIARFSPHCLNRPEPFCVLADVLYNTFDLGNGHLTQRLRRAYGLPVAPLPNGFLMLPKEDKSRRRIVLHFEPGAHADWQRKNLHANARRISDRSRAAIQQFISTSKHFDFVEVGLKPSGFREVVDATGTPLDQSIRTIASADYFVGIMSGPLHIAVALGVRTVCVVNFPSADDICLPTLKDINQVESEWFYPQSVILHQEGNGRFAPMLSTINLERAINGELYPYWSNEYLDLIFEPIPEAEA